MKSLPIKKKKTLEFSNQFASLSAHTDQEEGIQKVTNLEIDRKHLEKLCQIKVSQRTPAEKKEHSTLKTRLFRAS